MTPEQKKTGGIAAALVGALSMGAVTGATLAGSTPGPEQIAQALCQASREGVLGRTVTAEECTPAPPGYVELAKRALAKGLLVARENP